MQLDEPTVLHLAGILASTGALLYAISDVLLLGYEVGPRQTVPGTTEADFEPYAVKPFSARDLLNLSALPASRLAWGGLLGVLATPLLLSGLWLVYTALRPAGLWQALAPSLLLACSLILAPFVHGSFIYVEQNAGVMARLSAEGRAVLGPVFKLQQRIAFTAYAIIGVAALLGSVLFSIIVARGDTLLPRWMAAVNPITTVLVYFLVKQLLPRQVTKYVEGAGFNIGFFLFALLLTITLW